MDLSKLSDADLQAVVSGDMSKVSDAGLQIILGSTPPKKPVSALREALDSANAVATGTERGLLHLLGMPVDTVANVLDLGKAIAGTPYLLAGKVPPEKWHLQPREDVAGSGASLVKTAQATPYLKPLVSPSNPEYEGGYLQAAGMGLPGATNPAQALMGITSAVAGKAMYDATGNSALAATASLAPGMLASRRVAPAATTRSNTIASAQAEGYVVPPSQAGAGWFNNRLESIAGKAALNQDSVLRNQAVTDRLGARSVGLGPNDMVTPEVLAARRIEVGRAGYAPLDRLGTVPTTPRYANEILDIENRYGAPTSPITSLRTPAVSELATELLPTEFTGRDINLLIQNLREGGNKRSRIAYGGNEADRTLGRAQVAGSRALENLVTEHLNQFGPSNVVPQLRDARHEIAKMHTVEEALNPATGDLNAHVFGRRILAGKPLRGDQEIIGNFAAAFPQLTRPRAGTPTPGVSALEAAAIPLAVLGGHAAAGPGGILAGGLPLLREPTRNLLLSDWYQKRFAKPGKVHRPISDAQQGALARAMIANGLLSEGADEPSR